LANGDSLVWDDDLGTSGVDSLAAGLWALYGDAISDGKYSKNGDWHEFTPDEVTNICGVLKGDCSPMARQRDNPTRPRS
jgi:hypothetical protein